MRDRAPLIMAMSAAGFAPLIEGGTTHAPVLVLKLMVLAMLTLHLLRWRAGSHLHSDTPLDKPAAVFLAAVLVSVAVAPYKEAAFTWLQLILCYMLYFFLAGEALRGAGSLLLPSAGIMFMGGLEAAWVLAQWASGIERANGTFFNPNMAAGYIAGAAMFSISFLVFGDGPCRRPAARAVFGALAVLCPVAIVLSGSRGGMVAFAAGFFVVLWRRSRILSAACAAALVAAVLLIPNPLRERVFSGEPFAYSRTGIWSSAARMAADHPMGVGLGNFKYEYDAYRFPVDDAVVRYGKAARTAHNEYLHFTAEMGLLGLAAIAFGLYSLIRALWYSAGRRGGDGLLMPAAAGAFGCVSATLAHSALDSNMHEPGTVFMLIFASCVGLEAGAVRAAPSVPAPSALPDRRRAAALGLVLTVLMAAWAVKPEVARSYFERGARALREAGPSAALAPAETAVAIEPGDASFHEQLAAVMYALYGETGDVRHFAGALEGLAEAARLSPHNARYPALSASLKAGRAGRLDDPAERRALLGSAVMDAERAQGLSPYDGELLYSLAAYLAGLGEADRAEAALVRLRDIEPRLLRGRFALARLYHDTGRDELSMQECYSIIRINEEMAGRRLGKADSTFVSVDIDGVRALLRTVEGA